jgi:hypothetical protein
LIISITDSEITRWTIHDQHRISKARRSIMNNIVPIAQISLAVIQYCVAAALVGGAAFSAWSAKKSKLLTLAAAIALVGLNSQAFAQSNSSCSDRIAALAHLNAPQTYTGLMFSGDLTFAEAQEAEGNNNECLLAARRAEQDLHL